MSIRSFYKYLSFSKTGFIVGCGHSGTSLILRLLGNHPSVYAIPRETRIFLDKERNLNEFFFEMIKYDILTRKKGKKYWIEKTPSHVHHMSTINLLRPQSKIISITRDPRDVACSLKARGDTFEIGLKRWINDNNVLLNYNYLNNLYIVKLENLISNPTYYLKNILKFLELPYYNLLKYHDIPVSWYANKIVLNKPVKTEGLDHNAFRNWQINQPIFKTTQRHKKDMDEKDKVVYKKYYTKIKPIATALGYSL